MNLAYRYPILFWNCANIIVDSMATDLIMDDEDEIGYVPDEEEEEDEDEKSSTVDYGKIAKAIGKMITYGVTIHLPDINKSKLTFSPNMEDNSIYYGLKGISKINDKIAEEIILCRPYNSVYDFLTKVKLNKPQVINLIKAGAFDSFGDRNSIMRWYIESISDVKKRLTLQNMQMLISFNLIPDELDFERRVFNFNKYLKKFKYEDFGLYYVLNPTAYTFYEKNFNHDLLEILPNEQKNRFATTQQEMSEIFFMITQKAWDNIYKKKMDIVRAYLKENEDDLLSKLNWLLMKENWDKYALGSLSKWEMDSVSFYQHEHELACIPRDVYCISNFFDLPEEPEESYGFTTKEGHYVSINKLSRIAGTVLDKDKTKHTVSILTNDGVVTVKIWNTQFSKYDKQISEVQPDGKKKVIEKSWFSRGNKIIFTGIRRGNNFIPKTYKNSEWRYPIQLITDINNDGILTLKTERAGD